VERHSLAAPPAAPSDGRRRSPPPDAGRAGAGARAGAGDARAGGTALGGGAGSAFAAPPLPSVAPAAPAAPAAPMPAPWAGAALSPEPPAGGVRIALRLPTGLVKRRFEPTDTVAALFKFAAGAAKSGDAKFELRTGYPPRQLADSLAVSLGDAGVDGAAVQMTLSLD